MEYLNSLPEDIEEICVPNKYLTSLDVRRFKNLKRLICNNNLLTALYLPETLQTLHCHNNQLTSLHLPKTLQRLYCYNNQLTSLHLPETLQRLYCHSNQLTSLHLNEKLQKIYCSHNPVFEILNTDDEDELIKKLQVLNQFRYLYYCLKYKKQFRDWLWIRIREPKIRENYLVANLHEDVLRMLSSYQKERIISPKKNTYSEIMRTCKYFTKFLTLVLNLCFLIILINFHTSIFLLFLVL